MKKIIKLGMCIFVLALAISFSVYTASAEIVKVGWEKEEEVAKDVLGYKVEVQKSGDLTAVDFVENDSYLKIGNYTFENISVRTKDKNAQIMLGQNSDGAVIIEKADFYVEKNSSYFFGEIVFYAPDNSHITVREGSQGHGSLALKIIVPDKGEIKTMPYSIDANKDEFSREIAIFSEGGLPGWKDDKYIIKSMITIPNNTFSGIIYCRGGRNYILAGSRISNAVLYADETERLLVFFDGVKHKDIQKEDYLSINGKDKILFFNVDREEYKEKQLTLSLHEGIFFKMQKEEKERREYYIGEPIFLSIDGSNHKKFSIFLDGTKIFPELTIGESDFYGPDTIFKSFLIKWGSQYYRGAINKDKLFDFHRYCSEIPDKTSNILEIYQDLSVILHISDDFPEAFLNKQNSKSILLSSTAGFHVFDRKEPSTMKLPVDILKKQQQSAQEFVDAMVERLKENEALGLDVSGKLNKDVDKLKNILPNMKHFTFSGDTDKMKDILSSCEVLTEEMKENIEGLSMSSDIAEEFNGISKEASNEIKLSPVFEQGTIAHEAAHLLRVKKNLPEKVKELEENRQFLLKEINNALKKNKIDYQLNEDQIGIAETGHYGVGLPASDPVELMDKLNLGASDINRLPGIIADSASVIENRKGYKRNEKTFDSQWVSAGELGGKKSDYIDADEYIKRKNQGEVFSEWEDGSKGARNGFVLPYGATGLKEDVSTFVEVIYSPESDDYKSLIKELGGEFSKIYLGKIKLLYTNGFISDNQYNKLISEALKESSGNEDLKNAPKAVIIEGKKSFQ